VETILGNALPGRRAGAVIATKVGMKMSEDADDGGLTSRAIAKAVDDSLRRSGLTISMSTTRQARQQRANR
jgi:aryl-alcohol dehydrogenase-like predicted oxidoreductase